MRKRLLAIVVLMLSLALVTHAAGPKTHTVTLGKASTVKLFLDPDEKKPLDIRIRSLFVDARLKEFTTGEAHEITERQFVIQRVYRVNDSLPGERGVLRWRWQRGGWLLVDRISGHITPLRLPYFDAFYSDVAWYRDYAAYCGITDTGEKLVAVVTQAATRKPILHRQLGPATPAADSPECVRPAWERQPPRVTFTLKDNHKLTFTVRGRAADLAVPADTSSSEDDDSD
jgi:hypothetical protein